MAGEDEEVPWYRQPMEAQAPQAEAPPQAVGQSADERAVSDYLSPGEGRGSLVGMLGAPGVDMNMSSPGAGTGSAGGLGALMLPMLLAQMQQRQQVSPLGAFANAYSAATGRPSPVQQPQGPSQYQQFQMIHSLMQDQALEKERNARLDIAQQAQQRLQDRAADDRLRRIDETTRKNANFQWNESKRMLGSNDENIRRMAASNLVTAGRKLGFDPGNDDEAIQAFAQGELTHKELNENALDAARGVDVSNRRGMTPGIVASIQQPGGLVAQLMDKDTVERKTKAADLNIKEAQLIEHQNPEFFKAKPELIPYVQGAARKMFGTTYDQLDDQAKALVMKTGQLNATHDEMQKYKAQQDVLYQKQAQLAQLHGNIQLGLAKAEGRGMFAPIGLDKSNIWVDRKTGLPAQGDDVLLTGDAAIKKGLLPLNQKQADIQNGLDRAKQEMANMKYLSDQMADRGLYSGSGNWPKGPLMAPLENFYKGTVAPQIAPTDSDRAILKAFEASKTSLINIDRQLGTLGVRAFGAYGPQMNTLSPTTGKQGVELTMSQVEDALDAQTKLMKLPGTFEQKRNFTPPALGRSGQAPATNATQAPNLSLPPASRMTLETFKARAMAKYPPEEAMQKINEFMSTHRIVD